MKRILFLLLIAGAMIFPSYAQRLIPKQQGVEIVGSIPLIRGEKLFQPERFGVGVAFTRYLKQANYLFLSTEYE